MINDTYIAILLLLGGAVLIAGFVICLVNARRKRRLAVIVTAVTSVVLAVLMCVPAIAAGIGLPSHLPSGEIKCGAYRLPDGEYTDTRLYGMVKLANLVFEHANTKSFDYRDYNIDIYDFSFSVDFGGEWYSSFEMSMPGRRMDVRSYECSNGELLCATELMDAKDYDCKAISLGSFRALLRALNSAGLEEYVGEYKREAFKLDSDTTYGEAWYLSYLGRREDDRMAFHNIVLTDDGIVEAYDVSAAPITSNDVYLLLVINDAVFQLRVPAEYLAFTVNMQESAT